MRRTLAGVLESIRRTDCPIAIVWQGKVKPVRYRLVEVLDDALYLIPEGDGQGSFFAPFTAIHSVSAAAPEPTPA